MRWERDLKSWSSPNAINFFFTCPLSAAVTEYTYKEKKEILSNMQTTKAHSCSLILAVVICGFIKLEPDALKEWKINIFKIIDTRISFYSRNTHLLPPKPKSSFSHLKRGIQDFHMNYVLVPADKAANNVVVV